MTTDPQLDDLRKTIDHLDSALMFLLAERTRMIIKIGHYKKSHNLPLQKSDKREADLQKTIDIARERNIDSAFIRRLFERMYQEAIAIIEKENTVDFADTLDHLRESIVNIDMAFCHVLAERFNTVKKVGGVKKAQSLPPLAPQRWEAVLNSKQQMAETLGISPDFIRDIFEAIHQEALRLEA